MENTIKHPTKSDYRRIQEFTDTIVAINSSLTKLNNHLEVLKRVGDVEALRDFEHKVFDFRVEIVDSYYKTLKEKNDED